MLWIKRHIPCPCKASEQWSSSMANHRFPPAEKKKFLHELHSFIYMCVCAYIYAFIYNIVYYCTNILSQLYEHLNIEIRNEEQI